MSLYTDIDILFSNIAAKSFEEIITLLKETKQLFQGNRKMKNFFYIIFMIITNYQIIAMDIRDACWYAKMGRFNELAMFLDLGGNPNQPYGPNRDNYKGNLIHLIAKNFTDVMPESLHIANEISSYVHCPKTTSHLRCLMELCKITRTIKTDLDAQDSKGNTALHYLIKRAYQISFENRDNKYISLETAIKILLNCGATINTKNKKKQTPVELIKRYLCLVQVSISNEKKKTMATEITRLENKKKILEEINNLLLQRRSHSILLKKLF